MFDLGTSTLRPKVRLQIAAVLIILAIWQFSHLSPLAYGSKWTKAECTRARWLKTWDFGCNDFFDDYSQYNTIGYTPQPSQVHTTVGGEADGRPAIVVPDNKPFIHEADQIAAGNQEHHTSIVEGKPEPGHDVFAAQEDAKSASVSEHQDAEPAQQHQPTTEKEKEVSAIGVVPGGVHGPVVGGTEKSGKESTTVVAEEKKDTTTVKPEKEDEKAAAVQTTTTAATEQNADTNNNKKPKTAGPLGEAEQEAERVAQELFPETS